MSRIALVAALEREVAPLVRSWTVRTVEHGGRKYRFFENKDAVLVCGGIGSEPARRAAEVVISESRPDRVLSVGFAGALQPTLRVADIIEPRTVVSASDGSRIDLGAGQGTLLSFGYVAGRDQKVKLAQAYDAVAVDMEAAAVAQAAQLRGVDFGALKVISDEQGFEMPAMEKFISADGQFRGGAYALHVAVRPWLWLSVVALARNSARATRALCGALRDYLSRTVIMRAGRQN